MAPTLLSLIQEYFPEEEWNNAGCIVNNECPPGEPGYPESCIRDIGPAACLSVQSDNARAWGPFGLLDICWHPSVNPASPFTQELWAKVLDPNVNVWMASVIWSAYGWAAWTTCGECTVCGTAGGTIPHPDGPLPSLSPPPPPPVEGSSGMAPVLIGLAVVVGLVLLDHAKGGG